MEKSIIDAAMLDSVFCNGCLLFGVKLMCIGYI
jgi:hypothetical protein